MNYRNKTFIHTAAFHLFMTGISIITMFPFIWMVTSSIKTKEEIWQFPPTLLPKVPQLINYHQALTMVPFYKYFMNTFLTSIIIVMIILFNSSLMAYVFTQFKFRGKNILFGVVLATYMLPSVTTYIPSYVILARFKLLDSLIGLIFSNSVSVFGIFYLRQCFSQLNRAYAESAKIDGATSLQTLWKIFFPMTKPAFTTLAIITFINQYNNYLWPSLIIKSQENFLLTIGLRHFLISFGGYGTNWGAIMAASTITIFPILFIFLILQNKIINSVSQDSGLKG